MYSTSKTNKHKNILITAGVVFIIAVCFILLESSGRINLFGSSQEGATSESTPVEPDNAINFEPPTEEEANAGNIKKQQIVDETSATDASNTSNQSELRSVDIIVVNASQEDQSVDIRAFVSGYVASGECSVTFSKDGETFSETNPATADATTTQCQPFSIDVTDFPSSGVWDVEVSYLSTAASGTANTTVEVTK